MINMNSKIKDIATMGMMVAILEVVKFALMFLPNVELVSLMIILFTLLYLTSSVRHLLIIVLYLVKVHLALKQLSHPYLASTITIQQIQLCLELAVWFYYI